MSEECQQYQDEVDRISEDLRTNEQELFQAEAKVNEIDGRLQNMHSDYFERYYDVPPQDRWKVEMGGEEILMEEMRRELEAAVAVMDNLIGYRELLATLLEKAEDDLKCCEQRCWMPK